MRIFQICCLIILFSFCKNAESGIREEKVVYIEENLVKDNKFEDVANLVEVVEFKDSQNSEFYLQDLFQISINNYDQIVTFSRGFFYLLDEKGNLIQKFGNTGKGPGEYGSMKYFEIDQNDNLWVFDMASRKFIFYRFRNGKFQFERDFECSMSQIDKFAVLDSSIITYSNYANPLMYKLDYNGQVMDSVYQVEDQLRIFMSKFNGGGLVVDWRSDQIYTLFPGRYEILQFTSDFDRVNSYQSTVQSEFRPMHQIPQHWDPYDWNQEQMDWVNANTLIGWIYFLEPNLIMVGLLQNTLDREKVIRYFNIFSQNGQSLIEGCEIPENTRMVGCHEDIIYLARNEYMDSTNKIVPLRLEKYRLKVK